MDGNITVICLCLFMMGVIGFVAVSSSGLVVPEDFTYNPDLDVENGTNYQSGNDFNFDLGGFNGGDGFLASAYITALAGGLTAIVVAVIAFVAVIGFSVVGSGEDTYSVRTITTVAFFSGLWALVSVFGVGAVTSIPVFGWVFYLVMTFAYFLGVWGEING